MKFTSTNKCMLNRDVKRSVQSNPVQDRSVPSKDGPDLGLKFGLGPFWTTVLGPVPRLL